MATLYGILSFSNIFTAQVPKAGGDPKFGAMLLLPPGDAQIPALLAERDAAQANTYPSGLPTNANICFDLYEKKITQDKEYFDPRFVGWYAFTCSAKQEDRPVVVDMNRQPVIDPALVYSGMMVHVNAGISGYTKGTGGVGGWLNGVMVTDQLGPMGRLDGKPSVEQMFQGVNGTSSPAAAPAPGGAPTPPAVGLVMTDKAGGATYQSFVDKNWTDDAMIAQGYATKPAAPAPAPAPAAAPTPPTPPAPAQAAPAPGLVMTDKAEGASYQSFRDKNWTDEAMIAQGYAITPSFG